jgi:hypothetical protein
VRCARAAHRNWARNPSPRSKRVRPGG